MTYLKVVVSFQIFAGWQFGGIELVGLRTGVTALPVEYVALDVIRAHRGAVHYDVP